MSLSGSLWPGQSEDRRSRNEEALCGCLGLFHLGCFLLVFTFSGVCIVCVFISLYVYMVLSSLG